MYKVIILSQNNNIILQTFPRKKQGIITEKNPPVISTNLLRGNNKAQALDFITQALA